jgi:hypothetical protein
MEPTTVRLVEEVAAVLRERIAPEVTSPWAASELRSIDAVLAVVAERIRHESRVTADDNADLSELLGRLRRSGVDVAEVPDEAKADPPALNVALRAALEASLEDLHDGHREVLDEVRSYLVRATGRDQVLYGELSKRRAF